MRQRRSCWIASRATAFRVASFSTCKSRFGWPRAAKEAARTRLDIADHISHWLSRHPGHGAHHQGGRGGLFYKASIIRRPSSGNRTGVCTPPNLPRATDQTVCHSRSARCLDAARAAGLSTHRHWRQYQQADWRRLGNYRAHHQSPPPKGDGEVAGSNLGGACFVRRAGRRCIGDRTD